MTIAAERARVDVMATEGGLPLDEMHRNANSMYVQNSVLMLKLGAFQEISV